MSWISTWLWTGSRSTTTKAEVSCSGLQGWDGGSVGRGLYGVSVSPTEAWLSPPCSCAGQSICGVTLPGMPCS